VEGAMQSWVERGWELGAGFLHPQPIPMLGARGLGSSLG